MEKDAGAVLLTDDHLGTVDPFGKPVVGWRENSQGLGGLHNPRGFGLLRIVLWKLIENVRRNLYDQPIIVENAGSIVIALQEDRVCLVQNFRMVGERLLPDAGAAYIKRLQDEKLWEALVNSLGHWRWEAPRGLAPPKKEEESLEAFILRTAKLEALEEAGLRLENPQIVGRVNTNPTFFPHAQYVVRANIASMDTAKPEPREIIGKNRLFTMKQLRELNNSGDFDDGLTLAALALCGLSL